MFRTLLATQILVFLVLNFGSLDVHLGFVVGCHETEREALLTFKHNLVHVNNRLSSWEGNDCYQWEGVGCNNVTAYVDRLDLHNPYYIPFLFNDSMIKAPMLDPSLIALSRLKYLDLSGNDFQGSRIPGFIGSFQYLRYLDLSSSNFSGIVPSQLSNLTTLRTLDLSDIAFVGNILSTDLHWISVLVSLQYLNIGGISISLMRHSMRGRYLPPSLVGLSSCGLSVPQLVRVFSNSTHLSNIQQLDLSYNFLPGSRPRVFSNMTSLTHLDLSGNYFNDSALLWLRSMRKLEYLDFLSGNWLDSFPRVFANMTSLRSLNLVQTNIKGLIPLWLSNLSELQHLYLLE